MISVLSFEFGFRIDHIVGDGNPNGKRGSFILQFKDDLSFKWHKKEREMRPGIFISCETNVRISKIGSKRESQLNFLCCWQNWSEINETEWCKLKDDICIYVNCYMKLLNS